MHKPFVSVSVLDSWCRSVKKYIYSSLNISWNVYKYPKYFHLSDSSRKEIGQNGERKKSLTPAGHRTHDLRNRSSELQCQMGAGRGKYRWKLAAIRHFSDGVTIRFLCSVLINIYSGLNVMRVKMSVCRAAFRCFCYAIACAFTVVDVFKIDYEPG